MGEKKKWDKYKTHGWKEELNWTTLVITITIITLNFSDKRQKSIAWIKHYNLAHAIYKRYISNIRL